MKIANLNKSTFFDEQATVYINLTPRKIHLGCEDGHIPIQPMECRRWGQKWQYAAEIIPGIPTWGKRQMFLYKICRKVEKLYKREHHFRIIIRLDSGCWAAGRWISSWSDSVIFDVQNP
ncbi:MAG: hypothetical protein Q4B29_00130 [Candidatus Saccharibacteria bacterium]|nr:hypothetical protein [Candidatus Saccharibacteria bacterium]